ncbi:hypothetical protein [Tumebacillus algifaecis]|uniref:hypothetical protein n=1 Tax=Tumebacillus algifaecis TaxID=1214604 RepID=UPI0012FD0936|nr:hypothetical protein [Tumebacillus algifaecis]
MNFSDFIGRDVELEEFGGRRIRGRFTGIDRDFAVIHVRRRRRRRRRRIFHFVRIMRISRVVVIVG